MEIPRACPELREAAERAIRAFQDYAYGGKTEDQYYDLSTAVTRLDNVLINMRRVASGLAPQ